VLIAYALGIGTAQAFMLPARDALLSEVAGADLMRAVTTTTIVQFGLQALGTLVGGSGRWIGVTAALCCQGVVLLAGALAFRQLRLPATAPRSDTRKMPAITDGLREVWHSERLRIPVLLATANALLFMGPYIVCVPLLVRDFYGGDVADLSAVYAMFPLGTIAGSLALLRYGGVERKGLASLRALFAGSFCLLSIAFGLPFWGLLLSVFIWGIMGSVFFNTSRTLVQAAAPPTHRARVLSVYSLGLFGSGPIGALQAGVIAEHYGTFVACGVSAVVMLALIVLLTLFSRIVEMK
jgi:MFS family permease